MNQFEGADIDARAAAALITATSDVALLIDGQGVIRDVSIGREESAIEGSDGWVGRHWLETVTVESRPKVLAMLKDASNDALIAPAAWRQLNHPIPGGGADVPVLYSALPVGKQGKVLAVGRDLRTVATLQQRLVDAQQAMERDYLRLRQTEARYRLLFETVSEAVIVADASTLAVVEANPAALRLFGDGAKRLIGRSFLDSIDGGSRSATAALLSSVRNAGRGEDVTLRLASNGHEFALSASLFRQDGGALLLLRLVPRAAAVAAEAARMAPEVGLLRALDRLPDAFVVTDLQGRVLTANASFTELAQLASGESPVGQSLDRWLGRSGVDLNVMMGTLKQHGVVRLFPTTLRPAYGSPLKVEISAVAVPEGDPPCLGFTIRDVERRLASGTPGGGRELPRSAGQLAELVGRVPMKDIVSETTDLIERMCIEAALELTGDNRASAAEMLGLSRQSLYVKLRRYGMGDLGGDSGS
ncbi:transcriptional regulator PpsR [Ideonella sp. DXS29W]|uniref:Transcriptional regulator PpsR n=1 Tax=Ideonella lacteola TaxID=2984193 RepID=A0ABU9BN67_9BURK